MTSCSPGRDRQKGKGLNPGRGGQCTGQAKRKQVWEKGKGKGSTQGEEEWAVGRQAGGSGRHVGRHGAKAQAKVWQVGCGRGRQVVQAKKMVRQAKFCGIKFTHHGVIK